MVNRMLVPLTLLALPVLSARSQGTARSSAADRHRLIELEDSWAAALVKRDAGVFRRMLAPGFVYTENDKLEGRDQVLRDVVSGPDTATAAHNEDMVPHLFGTTGIVTGWLIVRGRSGGKPFEHRYRFTDTWVKRNGDWQIVAAEDYLAPK